MTELSTKQIRNRLKVAAFKIAQRRWPDLIRVERSKPEPNLLAPKELVTRAQLEDFYFEELCRRHGV